MCAFECALDPRIFNVREAQFELVAIVVLKEFVLSVCADDNGISFIRKIKRELIEFRIESRNCQDVDGVFLYEIHT